MRSWCFSAARQLLFFFGSTGLPGYIFCLYKLHLSPDGTGDRRGLVLAAATGAASITMLPRKAAGRIVHNFLTSSLLAGVFAAYKAYARSR